ncbi:hypothetical protein VVMO6_02648 [Vibrio vulnificus MO6-24/O]|nr:hypothetical protein VVMO6_02648 [Vibrio vulnificus MO6-24/O]
MLSSFFSASFVPFAIFLIAQALSMIQGVVTKSPNSFHGIVTLVS